MFWDVTFRLMVGVTFILLTNFPIMEYNETIGRSEISLKRGKNFEESNKNNFLHRGVGSNDLYEWMLRKDKQK